MATKEVQSSSYFTCSKVGCKSTEEELLLIMKEPIFKFSPSQTNHCDNRREFRDWNQTGVIRQTGGKVRFQISSEKARVYEPGQRELNIGISQTKVQVSVSLRICPQASMTRQLLKNKKTRNMETAFTLCQKICNSKSLSRQTEFKHCRTVVKMESLCDRDYIFQKIR